MIISSPTKKHSYLRETKKCVDCVGSHHVFATLVRYFEMHFIIDLYVLFGKFCYLLFILQYHIRYYLEIFSFNWIFMCFKNIHINKK